MDRAATPTALLGDTTARDYSRKLRLFNAFAGPEIRRAIATLELQPGMRILDAGCGTGEALRWLSDAVGPDGEVTGIDLATAHVQAAKKIASPRITVMQADLLHHPFVPGSFDLIWCINTINHLRDPVLGVQTLAPLLRPGGRVALGQTALLPDMFFAWDARLERLTNEAVRQYYRERYQLEERDLTTVRGIFGVLLSAPLGQVKVQTFVIERVAPLRPADEVYLLEAIFRETWGERLRPYLSPADYTHLARLCDPDDAQFALRRPDFHFVQTFTLAVGQRQ
jgi:SAM-dependent methyltransferase